MKASPQGNASSANEAATTLGRSLRDMRRSRQMTLEQVADTTGVSISLLSQMERGAANPTFETLLKLSTGLGVPLPAFFEGVGAQNSFVVRRHERMKLVVDQEDRVYELLTPDIHRSLEMLWVVLHPNVWSEPEPYPHPGEECAVLLQGRLEAHVGEEVVLLEEGDSLYLRSDVPHRYFNPGPQQAVGVWAYTPPSY
jgi:transcriptional regulator with XRE-family HTH domain